MTENKRNVDICDKTTKTEKTQDERCKKLPTAGEDQPILAKVIRNRPEEPEFKLDVLPPVSLKFKYCKGQEVSLQAYDVITIKNTTKEKHAFKIKSSSNDVYESKPSIGFIEPDETVYVRVMYKGPRMPPERFHVAAFHTAAGDAKTVKEAFTKKTDGVKHFYCLHEVDGNLAEDGEDKSTVQ
uniref:Major sperm protein n=1 Tax=Caenorhabditis japonica TaxID=281687 RepID=A0A8R1I2H0_CAEJA